MHQCSVSLVKIHQVLFKLSCQQCLDAQSDTWHRQTEQKHYAFGHITCGAGIENKYTISATQFQDTKSDLDCYSLSPLSRLVQSYGFHNSATWSTFRLCSSKCSLCGFLHNLGSRSSIPPTTSYNHTYVLYSIYKI